MPPARQQPMTARSKGRHRRAAEAVDAAAGWAAREPSITALGLVGSYAAGRPGMASDVDLVLLTAQQERYVRSTEWIAQLYPGARLIRTARWGPVTERRVRLRSGLQVELGFTGPAWAQLPLDPGTARVLAGGCRILYDPDGALARAVAALAERA